MKFTFKSSLDTTVFPFNLRDQFPYPIDFTSPR